MKVLVINADCVQTNSSANLCHLAYLRGLVDAGHEVHLLSAAVSGRTLDEGMVLPEAVRQHTLEAASLYERASLRKRAGQTAAPAAPAGEAKAPQMGLPRRILRGAKNLALKLYGIHGIYATFVRRASRWRWEERFDCVISLSTPVASHAAAHALLQSGRVRAGRWIQIWEDPWYADVYSQRGRDVYREEQRLLKVADRICYVSPLTLEHQKQLFPEAADKMYWQPLPYYYPEEKAAENDPRSGNRYGYFGNYYPAARNLEPFYRAAVETGIAVSICGDPAGLFAPTERVHIHSRLTLDKLRPLEDSTNVLVFLCNRRGGQIPGKIYQYSATRKTILFIMDGTEQEQRVLRDFFGQLNRYVFCENTQASIRAAIGRIEAGDLGPVRSEPLEQFAPNKTIENILNGGETAWSV